MALLLRRLAGSLLAVPLVAASLQAQSYWFDDKGEHAALRVEFLRPFLSNADLKLLTGGLFLSATGKLGQNSRLEAELPLATGGDQGDPHSSAFLAGNPYFGLRLHQSGKPFSTQLGLRFPVIGNLSTSSEAGVTAAALSDADREESFFYKTVTVRAGIEIHPVTSGSLLAGIRLGSSVFLPTEGGDLEAFLDYGGRIGLENASLLAAVALTGRWFVTSSDGSLGDRTEHQLTGMLDLRRGPIRPGVLLRVPLDDSPLDAVLGLRLTLVP